MSKEESPIRFWIGIVVLIAISIMMIVNPEMVEGAEIKGRQTIFKSLLVAIWGIPAGIVGLALAGWSTYRKIERKSHTESHPED